MLWIELFSFLFVKLIELIVIPTALKLIIEYIYSGNC